MKRMALPVGPGASVVPAAAGEEALNVATSACRAMRTITADVGVSGSVGGHRAPSGHLVLALAAPARRASRPLAPIGPIFIFVSLEEEEQHLFLVRDNRVLANGPPAAVLEALTGAPRRGRPAHDGSGCAVAADATKARQLADEWMTMPDGTGAIYLHQAKRVSDLRGRSATVVRYDASGAEWHAEYRDFQGVALAFDSIRGRVMRRFDLGGAETGRNQRAP